MPAKIAAAVVIDNGEFTPAITPDANVDWTGIKIVVMTALESCNHKYFHAMSTKSKHSEISRHLETEIASGKYGDGSRLPSEVQLVKQFKVSRPTVARAFA